VDTRDRGADILIMARTDARATHGLDEALARCNAFVELGADITFLEAPQSEEDMRIYCREVPGPKMATLVERGKSPLLPHAQLEQMGFKLAVYPLTLLNASIRAMQQALGCLQNNQAVPDLIDFKALQEIVGFKAYDAALNRYASQAEPDDL
jgi:2-methylisocitrate lyase-like PEP mutase family enzyme